jgi:hypothetical protein
MVLTRAQRIIDYRKSHPGATHYTTPTKTRILGACEYLKALLGVQNRDQDRLLC